MVQVIR